MKQGGYLCTRALHKYITKVWADENVPQQWKDANVVTIYKNKGDKAVCGNSRGISLLAVAGKVLAKVMLQRLIRNTTESILPESQCGFRKSRSTVDMIFTARQLQEKCREQHQDLFMAFVDFSKAFDTVQRELLWEVLIRFGCPKKFVNIQPISCWNDCSGDHRRTRVFPLPCTYRSKAGVCISTSTF